MTSRMALRMRIHACAPFLLGLLASSAVCGSALAQARVPLERNLPPVTSGQGRLVIGPQDLGTSSDDTPLGVTITGLSLIGAKETVTARATRGVRIGAIGDGPQPRLAQVLAGFVGQPLSRKAMGDIQTAIARVYREAGYPFVSVTLPPQEVTSGVLTLRVVEFRTGAVKVSGAEQGREAELAGRVRTATGERIDATALDEDLAWLNRFPYRSVSGVFSPGDELGLSTLTLEVTPQKPWQAFAGWSNSGTKATGLDRYFVGFGAALPALPQSFLSYQFTGSDNFWSDSGSLGPGPDRPSYYSHAGRLVFSTGARQSIEIAPSFVATRQRGLAPQFTFTNTTLEVPVYYRTAISNLLPGIYAGDLVIGAVGKSVSRSSFFDRSNIGGARAAVFELVAGWTVSRSDAWGSTSADLRIVINPGGVLGGNSTTRWQNFSGGRVSDVTYAYGLADITRVTRLGQGFNWVSQAIAQIGNQPLPDTEQMGLGGLYGTRGYSLDDATVDTGVIWRNELRMPTFSVLPAFSGTGVGDQLSPFVFVDLGWGRANGYQGLLGPVRREDYSLASIGTGVDYTLGRNLTASLVAGYALSDAAHTKAGDVSLQGRLFVSF